MKHFLFLGLAALILSCSPENSSNTNELDLNLIFNSTSQKANSVFDTSSSGIYKGVFATNDASYHGKLTINFGNDDLYNALLTLNDGTQIGFVRSFNEESADERVVFKGNVGSFTFIPSVEDATIIDALLFDRSAQAHLVKETSNNQVRMQLGTFVDGADTAFGGTWDFLSTSTTVIQVPTPIGNFPVTVNVISEVVIMKTGGPMLSDTTMEDFTVGVACPATIPQGVQSPFYTGEQTIDLPIPFPDIEINEFAAGLQNSDFAGANATWNFLYSQANGNSYFDIDCNVLTGGVWSWNGRNGSISLD